MANSFDHLVILGRPAGGKSEFIEFLEFRERALRTERYHVGDFEGVDDFLWLWEKFLDDDVWEAIGMERLYSDKYGTNYGLSPKGDPLLKFCIQKFNGVIAENYLSRPDWYDDHTLLIEFSRGNINPYSEALPILSKEVWERAAIFFLDVTYEESWRKNVARYEAKLAHSILAHMVPREVHERLYKTHDWDKLTQNKPKGYLELHGVRVPFVTVPNEPEIKDHGLMAERYQAPLDELWKLYLAR